MTIPKARAFFVETESVRPLTAIAQSPVGATQRKPVMKSLPDDGVAAESSTVPISRSGAPWYVIVISALVGRHRVDYLSIQP